MYIILIIQARDLRTEKRVRARDVLVGLRDGYIKFEKDKVTDLSATIRGYVDNQLEFYKVQTEQWQRIMESFKYTPEEIEASKKLSSETRCEDIDFLEAEEEESEDEKPRHKKGHRHGSKDKKEKSGHKHHHKKSKKPKDSDDDDDDSDDEPKKPKKKSSSKKSRPKKAESVDSDKPEEKPADKSDSSDSDVDATV